MRIDAAHHTRVTRELRAVAFHFGIEKAAQVGALVTPCFEVDDPAHAIRDERAVERDMDERPGIVACKRKLALRVFMRRIEQPSAARVAQDAANHFADDINGMRNRFALDAFVRELALDPRAR